MKKLEMTDKMKDMEPGTPCKTSDLRGGCSLLKLLPNILRARDYRLYTQDGRRLVDLWLNGGAAVLGHTPPNVLRELKNAASRGLYSPLPHFSQGRFIKALLKIFPGYSFRLFAAPPQELETLIKNGEASLWRPFANPKSPLEVADNAPPLLVPVLPGVQGWKNDLPVGLCITAAKSKNLLEMLPPGDVLSGDIFPPILLTAASRGIYDIIAAAPERANPALPKIEKTLQKNISSADAFWRREGIYLYYKKKPAAETHEAVFRRFLDAGFLFPPVLSHPLILPASLSAGEEAKLAAALETAAKNQ